MSNAPIELSTIRRALILGAGTLGCRIGLQCALSDLDVVIYDINESAFERAKQTHDYLLGRMLKKEQLTIDQYQATKNRISWTTDPFEAAQDIDFVSESVTEDIALKNKVWAQFGALVPEHAVLTTNTSYLLPSLFAEATGRPDRFCAFHFHDVFHANVVDVMPHPGTAEWVVDLLMELGKKLNQIPVFIRKETNGYLFNKLFGAILSTAGLIAADGIASPEDVDRSWMGNFKMPIGPFGMMDEVGIDTAWHVTKVSDFLGKEKFLDFLQSFIDRGKLGVKSGEGFYTYPRPAFKNPDFLYPNQ